MDPLACLLGIDDSIHDHDDESAEIGIAAYQEWRSRGGWEPQGVTSLYNDDKTPVSGDHFCRILIALFVLTWNRYPK